ncbi:3-oxoacyl-[acyl-carrier-protein] synthase-1 [Alteromonadaceae bacterium Bs31]|nr:3-oxoacyl-[acyl-carrier-protein] synthase-1 [Alteromonadaceae bacterium Bs31]
MLARETLGNLPYISMPGVNREPGHLYSEEPYLGEALSHTFKEVLNRRRALARRIYSSQNGELYFAKEHVVAMIRSSQYFNELTEHIRPIEFFGDVGAALASILVVLAAFHKETSLIYCASDMGLRGAVCVN